MINILVPWQAWTPYSCTLPMKLIGLISRWAGKWRKTTGNYWPFTCGGRHSSVCLHTWCIAKRSTSLYKTSRKYQTPLIEPYTYFHICCRPVHTQYLSLPCTKDWRPPSGLTFFFSMIYFCIIMKPYYLFMVIQLKQYCTLSIFLSQTITDSLELQCILFHWKMCIHKLLGKNILYHLICDSLCILIYSIESERAIYGRFSVR